MSGACLEQRVIQRRRSGQHSAYLRKDCRWFIITPLDRPVVPEVKMMSGMSSPEILRSKGSPLERKSDFRSKNGTPSAAE